VPNTSSVVKTGLVLNGLNMSSFNGTDQLKQLIIGAVVAALGVDASNVFVDSIGEVSNSNATASSTRRQLSTTGISAVVRIVTDVAQADAIGVSLEQKMSDGALLESMATEAELLGLGAALATTLRETTVELTAPPTVTGESGIPRLAEPETASPTPVPKTEDQRGGVYIPVLIALAILVAVTTLVASYKRTPKEQVDPLGKKPGKKMPVAMVVPTDHDDTPVWAKQEPPTLLESVLGPPSWMGADVNADAEAPSDALSQSLAHRGENKESPFRHDLRQCGRFPPVSSLMPDLPDLSGLETAPFEPPPLPPLEATAVSSSLAPPWRAQQVVPEPKEGGAMSAFTNPAMLDYEDDELGEPVLGPPKSLLSRGKGLE
jgi:hypothetical protein